MRNAPSQLEFFSLRNGVIAPSGQLFMCGPLSVLYMTKVLSAMPSDPPPMKWSTLSYGFATRRTAMPRKSYKPEEIVAKLRQVDVLTSQSQSVGEAIRSIWRREGLKVPARQPKRARLWLNDGSCDSHSGHTAEPTRRC